MKRCDSEFCREAIDMLGCVKVFSGYVLIFICDYQKILGCVEDTFVNVPN